jgi:glycerate kinase
MAAALGVRFLDAEGEQLPQGGGALAQLDSIDVSGLDPRLHGVSVTAAADVTNPLCGPEGASLVYGPQKGASAKDAAALDTALWRYADVVERDVGLRVLDVPGAGAAGGLGAGLIAFLAAEVRSGFEIVAEVTGLVDRIAAATLVITGEGRLDGQTAYGKTVAGVAGLAADAGVPVLALPGSLGNGWESLAGLFGAVEAVEPGDESDAERLAQTAERAIRAWLDRVH